MMLLAWLLIAETANSTMECLAELLNKARVINGQLMNAPEGSIAALNLETLNRIFKLHQG
jgi:hypothetical protein